MFLLLFAPALFGTGQFEVVSPEERLRQAADLIAREQYNTSVPGLVKTWEEDPEQAEVVEEQFREIRSVYEQYLAKGEEVQAKLLEILSEDLTADELLPRAIEALDLIAEMEDILPDPNPRDAELITELRYTVQLNIDRRRFQNLMEAAALRLAEGDFAGAAEIYINGVDDLAALTSLEEGESEISITLENGLDIQRPAFEIRDYGILGTSVAAARESVRAVGLEFAQTAPVALDRSEELSAAFESGDFTDVEAQISGYLAVLGTVTRFSLDTRSAGEVLAEAEAFVAAQRLQDEEFRYDWHIRFLRDIVLGRPGVDGEGLLVTMEAVRQVVEEEPILAVRQYGDGRYLAAVETLSGIDWPRNAGAASLTPVDAAANAALNTAVSSSDQGLQEASLAFTTYMQILSVSRVIGVTVPAAPARVGGVEDAVLRREWSGYVDAASELIRRFRELEDPGLAGRLTSAAVLAVAGSELREIAQRAADGVGVASARRTTIAALDAQRDALTSILGGLANPESGTLRALSDRGREFRDLTLGATLDDLATAALGFREAYSAARILDHEQYERDIVEAIAAIEFNGLDSRVASLRTRTDTAERQVNGITEAVVSRDELGNPVRDESGRIVSFQALRRYPDRARDTLVPMVGRVSGTRIVSTADGEFQLFLNEARAFIERYRSELPHVVQAPAIQNVIRQVEGLAATVGEVNDPALFQRARTTLQRALDAIVQAQSLEAQGEERVSSIRQLLDAARRANQAENLVEAGENLAQAERLLKSDDSRIQDASDLFGSSLEVWYRPALEQQWNAVQQDLNAQIASAQADIVITRVQQAVRTAQPLVDDQLWMDALKILQEADDLWSSVFPQNSYPPLLRLLRYVETAIAKQNERELREDDADYDKLAPILSRATQAVSQGLYTEAARLLDQFLRAQPNNLEARLLEVDIALASEEGAIATKLERLIAGALPEGVARADIDELEPAAALELQSLLIAIVERLSERTDVSRAILARIEDEVALLEDILSPPPVVIVTPDLRAEAARLVDRALGQGPLETLTAAELSTAIGLLENALEIDPAYTRAIDLLSFALRLPNAPRRAALDATEQQVFKQARDAFARGDLLASLQLVEQLWANSDNQKDTELNRFRQELLDALRRR